MKKEKIILLGVCVAGLLVIVSVYKLKIAPFLDEKKLVAAQLRKNESLIKGFLSRPEGPPSGGLADAISERSEAVSGNYQLGMRQLGLRVQRILPPEDELPSIYWLDVLDKTHKMLLAKAAEAYVSIPEEVSFIGFGGDVSKEDVPRLLRKLEATNGILQFAFDAKVNSVDSLAVSLHETTEYPNLLGIRFDIGFSGTLNSLIGFLHILQSAPKIFVVDKVSLAVKKDHLTTDVIIWDYYTEAPDIESSDGR